MKNNENSSLKGKEGHKDVETIEDELQKEDFSDYQLPICIRRIRKDWEEIQCHKNLKDDEEEETTIEADDVSSKSYPLFYIYIYVKKGV